MQTVIIVIHLMIVSVLIGAVLLQKSEGGGLGMGGGAGFMSSRGTANLCRGRRRSWRGFSLSPAWRWPGSPASTASRPRFSDRTDDAVAARRCATPVAPPTSGGVLDTLKKVDEQQAPSGPQAPRSQ